MVFGVTLTREMKDKVDEMLRFFREGKVGETIDLKFQGELKRFKRIEVEQDGIVQEEQGRAGTGKDTAENN